MKNCAKQVRNQGATGQWPLQNKFTKMCFVVRYNNKSQSFCSHQK